MARYEFTEDPQNVFEEMNSEYQVWVLMKNYNCWHLDSKVNHLCYAEEICKRLERKCACWTEIRLVTTHQKVFRRYKKVEDKNEAK